MQDTYILKLNQVRESLQSHIQGENIFDHLYNVYVYEENRWKFRCDRSYQMSEYLSPYSLDVYSPLNAYFLYEAPSIEIFNQFEVLLARDGLLSLLHFFMTHPDPDDLKPFLLIHDSLASFVPRQWLSKTAFYNYYYKQASLTFDQLPLGLIITGLLSPSYCSPDQLKEKLECLFLHYGKENIKNIPIVLQLSSKEDVLSCPVQEVSGSFSDVTKYMNILQEYFGDKLRFLNWEELQEVKHFSGQVFVDIQEDNFCVADSLPWHILSSKGAMPFSTQKLLGIEDLVGDSVTEDLLLELSPFHGLAIHGKLPSNYDVVQKRMEITWKALFRNEDFTGKFLLARTKEHPSTEREIARKFYQFAKLAAKWPRS